MSTINVQILNDKSFVESFEITSQSHDFSPNIHIRGIHSQYPPSVNTPPSKVGQRKFFCKYPPSNRPIFSRFSGPFHTLIILIWMFLKIVWFWLQFPIIINLHIEIVYFLFIILIFTIWNVGYTKKKQIDWFLKLRKFWRNFFLWIPPPSKTWTKNR